MNPFLNPKNKDLLIIADNYASKYQNARPFPNIHFDNFFNPELLENVLSEFPDL